MIFNNLLKYLVIQLRIFKYIIYIKSHLMNLFLTKDYNLLLIIKLIKI